MSTHLTLLVLGILFGAVWGAVAWELLVADPLRRRVRYLERRLGPWQYRTAIAYLKQVMERPGALDLDDNERWSRKAPTHVRIVK